MLSQVELLLISEIFFAMILGGMIGIERQIARKPAGLRTHMLVCGASTLIISLSEILILRYSESPASATIESDPINMIQAIVVGIGFIGAGTIIQRGRQERIEGLTTAASLLFTAGIGIGVALGLFKTAAIVTVLVLIINFILKYLENWIEKKSRKT